MALLKSKALIEQETLQSIREKEAEACYELLKSWEPKVPITSICTEPPRGTFREDDTPFGYSNSLRPAPNKAPQKRWSEI